MKTDTKAKKLAAKIADTIMTNGAKEKAQRLVLELPGKRAGGGWSRGPLIDRIAEILIKARHDPAN